MSRIMIRIASAAHLQASAQRWIAVLFGVCFLAVTCITSATAEKLTICHAGIAGAFIPLAKMRGYFAEEKLDIEIRIVPSGLQALQAMLDGDCTLSVAAVPPISYQSLRRNDFRILAALSSSGDLDRIIVRRDHGINAPANLRGRRIVVPEGTSSHYLLDTYLTVHGIPANTVTKRYLPAQDIPGAFLRGEADAAVLWEPRISKLADALGAKAAVFPSAGLVVNPYLLLVGQDYLQTHPAAMQAILRALIKAEVFVRKQPAQAKALIAPYFKLNAQETDITWALLDFRVSLDQTLLFILESVARWQIRQLPPGAQPALPNYLDFLHTGALSAVKPGAVTIIE